MNEASIRQHITSPILGKEVSFFEQCGSTNIEAKQSCENEEITTGKLFVAAKQLDGKGTDGNSWTSNPGNLYLSISFGANEKIDTRFPLYPAVAICKTLRSYGIAAHVKWPNDVLVGHKKIAGILCEGVIKQYMIVGLGLNINQNVFSEELKGIATSMQLETGKDFKIEKILAQILKEYEDLLYGDSDIRQEWLSLTQMLGKTIYASMDGTNAAYQVIGLSPEGFLQIEKDGKQEIWMARRGLDISANY